MNIGGVGRSIPCDNYMLPVINRDGTSCGDAIQFACAAEVLMEPQAAGCIEME